MKRFQYFTTNPINKHKLINQKEKINKNLHLFLFILIPFQRIKKQCIFYFQFFN